MTVSVGLPSAFLGTAAEFRVLHQRLLTYVADAASVLLCVRGYESLNRANSIVNMICLTVMCNSCVSS